MSLKGIIRDIRKKYPVSMVAPICHLIYHIRNATKSKDIRLTKTLDLRSLR